MNRYSRGDFLGIGAALATGFGIGDFGLRGSDAKFARARSRAPLQEAGDVTPDLILVGGFQEIGIVRTVVGGRTMHLA